MQSAMRLFGRSFFAIFMLVLPFATHAQVCCPSGCVQDGARCVRNGTQTMCTPVTCTGAPGGSGSHTGGGSGSGSGGGGGGSQPILPERPVVTCPRPHGDYANSCDVAAWDCRTLVGSCKARDGSKHTSRVDATQCLSDVRNFNGILHCDTGTRKPGGSYTGSCRDIWTEGSFLHAQCQRANGDWVAAGFAAFTACRKGFENIDGALRCGP